MTKIKDIDGMKSTLSVPKSNFKHPPPNILISSANQCRHPTNPQTAEKPCQLQKAQNRKTTHQIMCLYSKTWINRLILK